MSCSGNGSLTFVSLVVLPLFHGFEADASGDDLVAQVRLVVAVDLIALVFGVVYKGE